MLSCSKLSKAYLTERGPVEAVKSIDVDVPRGEFAAIVGRSGSGKSSLLAMIGGLSRPTEGTVRVEDTDIWALSESRRAAFRNSRVGFVFQFASLLPTLPLIDNVALPALLTRSRHGARAYQAAANLLERLGLADHLDAYPAEVSAGQQRRAVIARALINRPALLLADEPTADLDEVTEQEMFQLFRELNLASAMTVVMVTHNLRLAERSDRIHHIAHGRLVT
jgi:ABC-type lipoprotein export system ATPase subunit